MSKHSDELRNKYINNPPEGLTADDIRNMSEDDLLDMDYFLNEDDDFDIDVDSWKEAPGASKYRSIIRKAERLLRNEDFSEVTHQKNNIMK